MSNNQTGYTKILAKDDSTTVTGYHTGGNLANSEYIFEYITVRQLSVTMFTPRTTYLGSAKNWRGFSTNAFLVNDKTGGKYLLVSITDTNLGRERVVVYKFLPQNKRWVHLTIADWLCYVKGADKFKKWGHCVIDESKLVAEGYFETIDSLTHVKEYPRTVVVDFENLDFKSIDQANSQTEPLALTDMVLEERRRRGSKSNISDNDYIQLVLYIEEMENDLNNMKMYLNSERPPQPELTAVEVQEALAEVTKLEKRISLLKRIKESI